MKKSIYVFLICFCFSTLSHAKVFYSKVKYVLDGDTIILEDDTIVRYIGMDAPESFMPRAGVVYYYGKESKEANEKLVLGKSVKLETDVQERDPQGRLLAYVWVGNVFVNAELVRLGYAQAGHYPPNLKYQKIIDRAELEAKDNSRGIWAEPKVRHKKYANQLKRYETARVAKVLDGDTVKLADGRTLRYIGIDAPEFKGHPKKGNWYGKSAYEYNKKLVEGKEITIAYDVQERDTLGRLLGYVFVKGVFVNAELVRRGYARVAIFPPNTFFEETLVNAEKEAKILGMGLWSPVMRR